MKNNVLNGELAIFTNELVTIMENNPLSGGIKYPILVSIEAFAKTCVASLATRK